MEVFLLLIVLGAAGLVWHHTAKKQREAEEAERRQREQEDRQRVDECGEVVRYAANSFGYLARQCISRDELEALIDNGIQPDALANEIARRMDEHPGLVLGFHPLDNQEGPQIKLTQHFRDRHVYVIGKSGSGKTNLLRMMILQDMAAGRGVGVIAPEQEMITEELLPYVPEGRLDDVIYVDPADEEAPVSFNPLHLDDGEDIDLRVDENMTIFKRAIGSAAGPRMDEILRQTFYALLERPETTLLDVEWLLNREDPTFRNQVIRESQDETTARFWRDTYPQMAKDAHLPITNRISRLTRPRTVRQLLCNPSSSLNFRQAMDAGKILFFNLSDGILGEANSQLLGQLIVSKFQTAVMSRADVAPNQRKPFYLYIDEFQTFTGGAAASYEKILSRARKYRLALILAHQQTGQIPQPLLKEIFGNVSTLVSFVVSRRDAVRLSGEFVSEFNGDMVDLPVENILRLRTGEAWCKIGRNTLFMKTYLAPQEPDYEWADQVMGRSRQLYGRPLLQTAPATGRTGANGKPEAGAEPPSESLEELDPGKVF